MPTIAPIAPKMDTLLQTLESVRSGLMVASPMASLSMHAPAGLGKGALTMFGGINGMRSTTSTILHIRGPSVAVMRSVHNIAVCMAAFAAFATAAVEVLRGVVLHSTAAVEHQVTTNLPKSFVAHQKQQAGGAGKDEEELKVLTNVLAKLEGALGALPEPLTSAATAAVAAHAADTLCKPAMPLYMMENTAAITSAMPPPHKVSHADIPLPPHAEVWTEDEDDEDDDEDDTPFNSGPGNGTLRVHPAPSYMHARILSPRASAPAALASLTLPSLAPPTQPITHGAQRTPAAGLAGLSPLLRVVSTPVSNTQDLTTEAPLGISADEAAAVDAELVQTAVRTMQSLHAAAMEDRVSSVPDHASWGLGGRQMGPELTQHMSRMARKWWLYQQQREGGGVAVAVA